MLGASHVPGAEGHARLRSSDWARAGCCWVWGGAPRVCLSEPHSKPLRRVLQRFQEFENILKFAVIRRFPRVGLHGGTDHFLIVAAQGFLPSR